MAADPIVTVWSQVLDFARGFVDVLGAMAVIWATMWSVFRSFTRERLYKILLSDFGARSGFVLGVVKDAKHELVVANLVLDVISSEKVKPRLKATISALFEEEMIHNRKTRELVEQIGRFVGESIQRNDGIEGMAKRLGDSQVETTKTNAVLAESVRNLDRNFEEVRDQMAKFGDKLDRLQEVMMQIPSLDRRHHGGPSR